MRLPPSRPHRGARDCPRLTLYNATYLPADRRRDPRDRLVDRLQQSGRRQARANDDPHTATDWTPAENTREAFKQESRRLDGQGGVESPSNYNEVESPGKRFRIEDGEL